MSAHEQHHDQHHDQAHVRSLDPLSRPDFTPVPPPEPAERQSLPWPEGLFISVLMGFAGLVAAGLFDVMLPWGR